MEKNFSELVLATLGAQHPAGHFIDARHMRLAIADPQDGTVVQANTAPFLASTKAIVELMRQTGLSEDKDTHQAFGAAVRDPIRTLARYKAWTQIFFADDPHTLGDDNAIPVDAPIGKAFASSPEGRPSMIRVGVQQWVRPSYFETATGLEIGWNTLKTAGWPILQRRMEEAADDMARKIDVKAKVFLQAAVDAVSGHGVSISGNVLTKSAVDNIIKSAAQIGFPITQGAINPGRLMDMTNWTNGSTSALPYFWSPQSAGEQVFRNLYAEGYGNIRWFVSISVPMNEVWLGGEPSEIGYHQHHGAAQSASDVDIFRRVDQHVVFQDDAYYVGNNYNLWKITITA